MKAGMKNPGMKNLFLLLLLTLPSVVQAQDYTYTVNNDGTITIKGYTGPGGAVTIPDKIDGLLVTGIGDGAFSPFLVGNTCVTSITIPDSVTIIGNDVFDECWGLTNVMIGSGVTSIGRDVFIFCPNVSAITVDALNSFYCSVAGVLFN